MQQLCRILRHAHCRTTHHRFAIDALSGVKTPAGKRLALWLLRHYPRYLQGSIDPDVRFRDFHNHVLHVRDGNWGGATRVAHQWYHKLHHHLHRERFDKAAHAAGVLTHYVSDVIQPLHTVSEPAEAVIHRPFEWTVDRSYNQILRHRDRHGISVRLGLADDSAWLGSLMMHSARHASKKVTELTRRYRLDEAVHQPKAALDMALLDSLAELFALTLTAIAAIIDRVANETEAFTGYPLPDCGLTLATCRATSTAPIGVAKTTLKSFFDKRQIRRLASEYSREGTLVEYLPPEIDIKRRVIEVYHQERSLKRSARRAA
ncbi:zinc dependent phospholipase C family protein [Rhodopirellula sp. MGV]|uniref:zinc dependent phospholipase C family protein n=1 Tax=Rhodopirellula sp. MGV TaxID=2023130 RepID=UPI000B95D75C|nr:zinc dependent phospholipase C family protein [Rhodopirellula sp. MGV]OYP34920.1 hypothetical protein CGZ80_12875 [Rhodopirellula sp. MGV]PNY38183.1 hypothetical protein C2E31_04075 [Rhodopirellula baltica]